MVAPVIPAINDADIGASSTPQPSPASGAGYVLLRLPLEVRDLFVEWLNANYRSREPRDEAHPRHARRQDYDSTFGRRTGSGPYA